MRMAAPAMHGGGRRAGAAALASGVAGAPHVGEVLQVQGFNIHNSAVHFEQLLQHMTRVERAEVTAHGDDLARSHQHERAPALAAASSKRLGVEEAAAAAHSPAVNEPRRQLLHASEFQSHVGEVQVRRRLGGLHGPDRGMC
jgi:hypothetical protein